MRAAGLRPLEPYPGAHRQWECLCLRCGEKVTPQYANVQQRGRGCDHCARRAQAAARRLCADKAVAAMLAAGVKPLVPYPGSGQPWQCQCMKCGAEVDPRYNDIQQGQGGCKDCGHATRANFWRIPESEAVAVAREAGLKPMESYRNNHTRWRCLCLTCDEETFPMLTSLKRGSAGCGFCSRHFIRPDKASATMLAGGMKPLEAYPGSNAAWDCQCIRCGRIVSPTYWSIKAGHGCSWCGKGGVLPDAAADFMRKRKLEPLGAFPGVVKPWICYCMKCKDTVKTCYATVQRRRSEGCRQCSSGGGFKASEDGMVYLITHAEYCSTKIGITGIYGGRLVEHQRYGWQIATTVLVPGVVAQAAERDVIKWWREELGVPVHLGPDEMPRGGWTETVASCHIDLAETIDRLHRSIDQLAG